MMTGSEPRLDETRAHPGSVSVLGGAAAGSANRIKTALRVAGLLALTLAACWLVYVSNGRPRRGIDDAQITFSYSSNLAAGRGLTYAHSLERVEGFTSLLWTLLSAVPFRLGLDEAGVLAILLAFLCATQLVAFAFIRKSASARQVPAGPFELAYVLLVFSSPMYFTWMSVTLMDTCLWGLLIALMSYVALYPPRSPLGVAVASVPFFLAPLARPEAAVVAPAVIALTWLRGRGDRQRHPRLILSLAAAFAASAAGVTLFRLLYFGYPLPNTFYAKVSPSLGYNIVTGGLYALKFAFRSGPVAGAASVLLLWFAGTLVTRSARSVRCAPRTSAPLADWELTAVVCLVLLAIPVLTGGDHFRGFRFFQPALPLMALTVVLFLAARLPPSGAAQPQFLPRFRHSPAALSLALLGLGCLAALGFHAPSWSDFGLRKGTLAPEFEITDHDLKMGERLRGLFAGAGRFPSVGVVTSGAISRTYPGPIVDLMGLNSTAIAHHPGDRRGLKNHAAFEKEAFFDLVRIDLLLNTLPPPPETADCGTVALKRLTFDPRFVKDWRYGVLYSADDRGKRDTLFIAERFLRSLDAAAPARFRETMTWAQSRWVEVPNPGGGMAPARR
jgi:arabinofuranosyltransferase